MYVHQVTRITHICMHAHIHMREGGEIHSHTHIHTFVRLKHWYVISKGYLILSGSCKTRMGVALVGVAPDQESLWCSSIGPTCSTIIYRGQFQEATRLYAKVCLPLAIKVTEVIFKLSRLSYMNIWIHCIIEKFGNLFGTLLDDYIGALPN